MEDHDVLRALEDGRHVAREEALPVADADDERDVHPRSDDPIRVIGMHDADGVRATNLTQREPDGLDEIAVVLRLDEVREDLGVGVGGEPMPAAASRLDLGVVLDDPVVDEGQLAGAVDVRVGVRVVRRARAWPSACGRCRDGPEGCRR